MVKTTHTVETIALLMHLKIRITAPTENIHRFVFLELNI